MSCPENLTPGCWGTSNQEGEYLKHKSSTTHMQKKMVSMQQALTPVQPKMYRLASKLHRQAGQLQDLDSGVSMQERQLKPIGPRCSWYTFVDDHARPVRRLTEDFMPPPRASRELSERLHGTCVVHAQCTRFPDVEMKQLRQRCLVS